MRIRLAIKEMPKTMPGMCWPNIVVTGDCDSNPQRQGDAVGGEQERGDGMESADT